MVEQHDCQRDEYKERDPPLPAPAPHQVRTVGNLLPDRNDRRDLNHGVLAVSWDTIRVFIHVLAASVWVGGQLTLAGLVPGLRDLSADAPRAVARRFNRIAWPAFAVLVATGIWNVIAIDPAFDTAYGRTVMLKVAVAALSGVAAFLHSIS